MPQKKEKNITLDRLAIIVQKEFTSLDERMNNRFNEVDNRLDRIEAIIIEGHRQRIDQLEDRVKTLEADFRSLVSKK